MYRTFLICSVAFAAYGPFLATYITAEIGGASLFSVVLPYLFAILSLLTRKVSNYVGLIYLSVSFILGTIFAFLRSVVFEEQFLNLLFSTWAIWSLTVLGLLASQKFYFTKALEKKFFTFVLLSLCLLHTMNSFLFTQKVIWINNGFDNSGYEILWGRFRGVLGGANIQGVYNAYLFYCLWKLLNTKLHWALIIWMIALVSVLPTVSRGGLLVLLIMLIDIFKSSSFRHKVYLGMAVIMFSVYGIDALSELSIAQRFSTGEITSGRLDKTSYFFSLLGSDGLFILFGIPRNLQVSGVQLSDNSFTAMFASYGIIIFLWYYALKYLRKQNNTQWRTNLFMLSVFCVLFLNNAYIWVPWLFLIVPFLIFSHSHENIINKSQS